MNTQHFEHSIGNHQPKIQSDGKGKSQAFPASAIEQFCKPKNGQPVKWLPSNPVMPNHFLWFGRLVRIQKILTHAEETGKGIKRQHFLSFLSSSAPKIITEGSKPLGPASSRKKKLSAEILTSFIAESLAKILIAPSRRGD